MSAEEQRDATPAADREAPTPQRGGRIGEAIRLFGAWNALWYLAGRLLESISGGGARIYRYTVVSQPVPAADDASTTRAARLTTRLVAADEAAVVACFPRSGAIAHRRFASGSECLAVFRDERFVGHIWLKRSRYEDDEVRATYMLEPAAATAWDYDVHIEPEFRLGRAFARLWQGAFDHMRATGVTHTVSRISMFNPGSIAAHTRLGARKVASATFVVAGSLQFGFFTCTPYVHLSLGRRSRARLIVKAGKGSRG